MFKDDESKKQKIDEVSEKMNEVRSDLANNLEGVVNRGEKIDVIKDISSKLVNDAKNFKLNSETLNKNKWKSIIIVILVIMIGIYIVRRFL
jgi:vesicle-associated membrane protein 7